MAQQQIKQFDEQLHWFWRLTTKWWFFPVFYVFLSLLFLILLISINKFIIGDWLAYIFLMPSGILFFIQLIVQKKSWFDYVFPFAIFFHLINIFLFGLITYKYRRHIVLKWAIITLLILLILEFSGCAISQLIDYSK